MHSTSTPAIQLDASKPIITARISQRVHTIPIEPYYLQYSIELTFALDVRQCLIYDSPKANARLIGVEYMVSPRVFETLPTEERKLWHSHEFEVKSGMLVMPAPSGVPTPAWEAAETAEMADVAPLYGKTYHFWQIDRGDTVPMGPPQLMGSFGSHESVKQAHEGGLDGLLKDRNERFGVDHHHKAKKREDIPPVEIHPGKSLDA
jgi:hypothetical protein